MMNYSTKRKQAIIYLVIGLLLTTLTPILSKHLAMPDFIKGFLTGLGLTLEFIALVKMQRSKKENQQCRTFPVLRN